VSGSSATLLWAFIAGVVAVAAILAALGAALVIYQRRFTAMHRAYSRNLLKAQEEERAWVAREVHDNVVQRLALISRELAGVRELPPAEDGIQARRLTGIEEEVRELSTELRDLAHRLHPALLERGELNIALTRLQSDVERAYGLRVATELPPTATPADPARALAVYRVAQEALHNVAVHAGVSEATLTLTRNEGALRLLVSDRGSGFDLRQRRAGGGLGLIGMRERAEIAGGKLTVTSRPGAGTTVELNFS
jgi:signal transduction histidine kinase